MGVGIEIVDLRGFRDRLSDVLIQEVFLPEEIRFSSSQARSWQNYAARYAAKKATFKALGAGPDQGTGWKDVEVVRDPSGTVSIRLRGRALEESRGMRVDTCLLSLSHTRKSAVAVVTLESEHE